MEKTVEHLKSLTDACRAFWTQDGQEEHFEIEMVRAEDHLAELKEKSWDYEIFVIAVAPEANKVYDGRLYYDIDHALRACDEINKHNETPGHWKVYRGIINFDKEAIKNADI